jgi:Fe-S oxidoreductase
VNIDTGEVSILEREVLAERRSKHTALPTRLVLGYLSSRSALTNAVVRRGLLQWGGAMQRAGAKMAGAMFKNSGKRAALLAPLYAPATAMAGKPMHALLPAHETHHALLITPRDSVTGTVFYFPGCGSERLHADIAMAAIFLLLQAGLRVVLPPKYLCCGYPARANAKPDLNTRQELRNTIVFNQIRSMLGHIDFDGCIVSCGTCREALKRIRMMQIFDAPLMDVVDFVLAGGLDAAMIGDFLYHRPCHDSLDGRGELLLQQMASGHVAGVPHCCSEAGTLALSRPDIAAAMFDRKQQSLAEHGGQARTTLPLITNCPACLSGLGRQKSWAPLHLATAMAQTVAPETWRRTVRRRMACAELIRF